MDRMNVEGSSFCKRVQKSWSKSLGPRVLAQEKQVRFEFTSPNIAERLLPCLITQQRKQKFQNAGPVASLETTPPDYSETKESWIPARSSFNGISPCPLG